MKYKSVSCLALLAAGFSIAGPAAANPRVLSVAPAAPPVGIKSLYKISLNGFNLGSLKFNATERNGTYNADSEVQLSALLGAFRWHGITRTAGTIAQGRHVPQRYDFEFGGSTKSGAVRMAFTGAEVTGLTLEPQSLTAADTVPLERQHLKNAMDPLSAILSLTRAEGDDPCAQKLAIFDGKQRFELRLSLRRQIAFGTGRRGEPQLATVCKVKYAPIAGFRASGETQALAANDNIDITFRRMDSSGMFVPVRVVIPTLAGDAVIEAERINIDAGNPGKVALVE